MKQAKLLIFLSLSSLLFSACEKDKNTDGWFQLQTNKAGNQFTPNEKAELQLVNSRKLKVDSVVYFLNDQPLTKKTDGSNLAITWPNRRLGYKNIKALVYADGHYATAEARLELVSDINPPLFSFEIVNTYPHDIKAYTQGLEFYRDTLYESTGNGEGIGTRTKGKSSVRKVNYKDGSLYQIVELDDQYFGEGLTVLNNKVYQLTWLSLKGFVYNADNLALIKEVPYTKKIEGWGLCNDGQRLYQSDGTEKIWILNPDTFQIEDNINVYAGANKIKAVNELEWVNGKIMGNVYGRDAIALIDPISGAVEGIVDLSSLKAKVTHHPDLDVLNGIAYNPKTNTYFVTGKNWDKMFELKINFPDNL